MHKTEKFVGFLFATLVLFCVCVFSGSAADAGLSGLTVSEFTQNETVVHQKINWYYSSRDNKYYLILPAGTNTASLTVSLTANAPVTIDGQPLVSGEKTSLLTVGDHTLSCNGQTYALTVLQAGDLPTVYITTESGSLAAVHADKSYKEPGSTLIINADGSVDYDGVLSYIKGRGNSTWKQDKKGYNIKLDQKADLLGLGKSKKWCLLANRTENSMIRNQISFELGKDLGVPFNLSSAQMNFYVNGEYQGIYLLTEKVEIGSNRIDIYSLNDATEEVNTKDLEEYPLAGAQKSMQWNTIKYAEIPNDPADITGGYLLELEKIYRYPDEASGFITKRGQAVVIKEPEYASKKQVEYISSYYQEFEDALYSESGRNSRGKHYSEYIDVESLAAMYIMLEFSANFDGCSSSFYLWKDSGGKLTAGPTWDYDFGFGIHASNDLINHVPDIADPNIFYARTCFIGNHNEKKYSLLAQAFMHNDFQDVVTDLWAKKFDTAYANLKTNITTFGSDLDEAIRAEAARWNTFAMANATAAHTSAVNAILNYVEARYAFLSKAMQKDTYYVKYDIGEYGAALVNDSTQYKAGDKATVQTVKNTTNYMDLKGFADTPDGAVKYQPGDEITVTGNTVLYARWDYSSSFYGVMQRILDFFRNLFDKILKILG